MCRWYQRQWGTRTTTCTCLISRLSSSLITMSASCPKTMTRCVCVCARASMVMCTCLWICVHVCMSACMCVRVLSYLCVDVHSHRAHACTLTHSLTCIRTRTHAWMHARKHTHIRARADTHTHTAAAYFGVAGAELRDSVHLRYACGYTASLLRLVGSIDGYLLSIAALFCALARVEPEACVKFNHKFFET